MEFGGGDREGFDVGPSLTMVVYFIIYGGVSTEVKLPNWKYVCDATIVVTQSGL